MEQFIQIGNILKLIHEKKLVHGDIRLANLIFGTYNPDRSTSYIIDFDFTSAAGEQYPGTYNGSLYVRHPNAKPYEAKKFDHDWYSLFYICQEFFPDTQLCQKHFDAAGFGAKFRLFLSSLA